MRKKLNKQRKQVKTSRINSQQKIDKTKRPDIKIQESV